MRFAHAILMLMVIAALASCGLKRNLQLTGHERHHKEESSAPAANNNETKPIAPDIANPAITPANPGDNSTAPANQ